MSRPSAKNQAAFTLLEVMITLGILVTMVFTIAQLMKSGFDVKAALSQKAKITHRFDVVMGAISRDLAGAFIVGFWLLAFCYFTLWLFSLFNI